MRAYYQQFAAGIPVAQRPPLSLQAPRLGAAARDEFQTAER
jgi:hypothetical protein